MIPLYLITGFLGAGKTTLMKNLIRLFSSGTVHLIINGTGVGCFKAAADDANTLELNARFIGAKDSSNIAPIMLYNQMHKTAAPAKSE